MEWLFLFLPKHNMTRRMSPKAFLYTTLIFFILSSSSQVSSGNDDNSTLTAYEVLEEYDFPVGLLPEGVLSYELDNSTGEFSVALNGSCTFSIDSYDLKYSSTITGKIATDKLSSLSGIKVKVLFFWLSIAKVIRDGDELEFSVGVASADFAVSNFDESPTCGCGFDCVGIGRLKEKMRSRLGQLPAIA